MAREFPSFDLLWSHYPVGSSDDVKASIGGNINLPWVQNTCAIRMSRALNASGHLIPAGIPRLQTAPGGDKARYAYRVAELTEYLKSTYGEPSVIKSAGQSEKAAREAVAGRRGVIVFEVSGWTDATGHIDLWNGSRPRGAEYFSSARKVLFWQLR